MTILERADSSLRNGAFIRLHTKPYSNSEMERELRHLASNGNNNVESWSAIQQRLLHAAAKEPGITQHSLYGEAIPDSLLEELLQLSQAHWSTEDNAILQIAIKDRGLIGALLMNRSLIYCQKEE